MDLLSIFIAILPVILIGLYIYKKDKIKESKRLLLKLFLYGIYSCFPAAVLGSILGNYFPEVKDMNFLELFLYCFIVISLIEELCKWFFTYKLTYNHIEFDSLYDMIVYAVFISLGFAFFENILYVKEYGVMTGILRGFLSVPGHACDGVLMGIYLGLSKLEEIKGSSNKAIIYKFISILIPMITHGIYDFCLFYGSDLFMLIFSIFVVFVDVICIKKVREFSKDNYKFKKQEYF